MPLWQCSASGKKKEKERQICTGTSAQSRDVFPANDKSPSQPGLGWKPTSRKEEDFSEEWQPAPEIHSRKGAGLDALSQLNALKIWKNVYQTLQIHFRVSSVAALQPCSKEEKNTAALVTQQIRCGRQIGCNRQAQASLLSARRTGRWRPHRRPAEPQAR